MQCTISSPIVPQPPQRSPLSLLPSPSRVRVTGVSSAHREEVGELPTVSPAVASSLRTRDPGHAVGRRLPHVLGTRYTAAPEFSLRPGPTGSIGQDHKTRNELKGRRAQGGEQRVRGRRRHRTPNLCRTRARRRHRTTIGTIAFDADLGATARSQEGFFPSGFPFTW